MPKVSVIMPAYNDAVYVRKAIDSVLGQSFSDFEFIIANDCSADNTGAIIQEYARQDSRVIYLVNEKNLGVTGSLNRGLKQARGEFIARIDSDDYWLDRDKLKKQVDLLEKNKDCGLCGTFAQAIDENEKVLFKIIYPTEDKAIKKQMLRRNCFVHSSVVFRQELAARRGFYDEAEKYVEDYGLWLRIGEISRLANLPEISLAYRVNSAGVTQKHNTAQIRANLNLIFKHRVFYPNFLFGWARWTFKLALVAIFGKRFVDKAKLILKR